VDVHASFVGKGCAAHEGLVLHRHHIRQLVHVAADLGKTAHGAVREHGVAVLQSEVRGDRGQIHVAAPFADPVDGALDLDGAVPDGRQGIRDGQTGVVMGVDADPNGQERSHGVDAFGDLLRERAAVRIAETDAGGTGFLRGQQRGPCVLRIGRVAVEEVFGVVNDRAARRDAVADRIGDHGEVFVLADAEDFADVQVP